jgi:hypothetical protein
MARYRAITAPEVGAAAGEQGNLEGDSISSLWKKELE